MSFDISMRNGKISVNGKDYVGRNVKINKDVLIIDGVEQDTLTSKVINISVVGDVEFIKGDCSEVHIQGSCGNVSTMSGDVTCADVNGDIKTMSGDVKCGNVTGNIKTMSGDITHK